MILQNRGLFYFDPRQPQYAFTTRGPIDLLLFESYRLDASTANDRSPGWPALPQEPTPRVGVQEVVAGKGRLTVRWDVALDLHRVGYAIYLQTLPFDFDGDPGLNGARRVVPTPAVPAGYRAGEPGSVAHEATITGLESGRPYYVVVRAFDDSPGRNEDRNKVVGFGRPT